MRRDRLKILVYLVSEVLIILGVFFIMSMTLGITNDLPPARLYGVLVFSLFAAVLLILTRVIMFNKSERNPNTKALCEHLRRIGLDATVELKQQVEGFSAKAFALYGIFCLLIVFVLSFVFIAVPVIVIVVAKIDALSVSLLLLGLGPLFASVLMPLYFVPIQMKPLMPIRVANRNIDLIELEKLNKRAQIKEKIPGIIYYDPDGARVFHPDIYRCNYVVQAKVSGLEDKLKAKAKPITVQKDSKSWEVVDVTWEGGELAQVLNSDTNLRKHFLSQVLTSFLHMEIIPHKEHQCIIRQEFGTSYVKNTFPTIETFEAYDRIAYHIRSIANASPNTQY